jgi:predicted translin family RNA/ssDNA-binding protein
MELQEENKIKEEIFELNQKLKNGSDKVVIKSTQHKIENLKKELHH